MTKKFLTLLLLATCILTSCANSSAYYEENLLQECRQQLDDTRSISPDEIEQIVSLEDAMSTSSTISYKEFDIQNYAIQYALSSQEENMIKNAKKEIRNFIQSTIALNEEDKEELLVAVDLVTVTKVDEPNLPSPVYYSNGDLLLDNARSSSVTKETIELALMRFLRIYVAGSVTLVPYQDSVFESEMAYTILFSHFKDGTDLTGYNSYHQHILDFIGIFREDALYGYFYGYDATNIPKKDLELFVTVLENNDAMCQSILAKWNQQFVVPH